MTTRTQLVIEGDLVTKVTIEEGYDTYFGSWRRESIGRTVRVDEWLGAVLAARGEEFFVPQLSNGRIVARKTKGVREVVVIEFQPAVRRIIWSEDKRTERAYQVAFPFVYMVVLVHNGAVEAMYVYYRNEGAESLGAELLLPNLPNVSGECNICTGTISGVQSDWSFAKKLDWLVRKFWDSQFNRDLDNYQWDPSRKLDGHPRTFAEWEEKTRSDPSFILKIQWRSSGKTIQQVLDEGVA